MGYAFKDSIHRISLDSFWQQFGITHILLIPFTGSTGSVVHFQSLSGWKNPSVQADLAIYSHMLGVPGNARTWF